MRLLLVVAVFVCVAVVSARQTFAKAGAYDVMMPDIKYTGGYTGMLAVANRAHECGVRDVPNPQE